MRPILALAAGLLVASGAAAQPQSRPIVLAGPFLKVPVTPGAPPVRLTLTVAGKVVWDADVELAAKPGDRFVTADIAAARGKSGVLTANKPAPGLALVTACDDDGRGDTEAVTARRPVFHFTAHRGWLNDPNGLVFDGQNYHLFFQHNPYGTHWGNMHWGHAESRDLFAWAELPDALAPRQYGDWAFSGSALVDKANKSHFGDGKSPPLVAAYTSTGRGECIVYSLDRGRTWAEYPGNPVVKHKGRDPKIFWHGPTQKFVMAVYDEGETGRARDIAFYTSPDLKEWLFESRFAGFFECPDLFELKVRGTGNSRWVLLAADGQYRLGDFDGRKFTPSTGKQTLWRGAFYAPQTVSNAPNGRAIQLGWARGIDTFDRPYSGQMTVPVELSLRQTPAGIRMAAEPVRELLRHETPVKSPAAVTLSEEPTELLTGLDANDITLIITPGREPVKLVVAGVPVTYDPKAGKLTVGDQSAEVPLNDGKLELRILVDRLSVELFAADGTAAFSLPRPEKAMTLTAAGEGGVEVTRAAAVK